jgi:hypothetical protein
MRVTSRFSASCAAGPTRISSGRIASVTRVPAAIGSEMPWRISTPPSRAHPDRSPAVASRKFICPTKRATNGERGRM